MPERATDEPHAASRTSPLPLAGVRVIALEQAVAAPTCTRQLADLGADVIKVEPPDGGDFARNYDGDMGGLSGHFAWLNRGKRSVVLDLKATEGREALARLLGGADVFVHNLGPGAVERLGCGYEALSAREPGLIWCGISGYGPDGPYRDKKAYDLLLQGEAGVLSVTGSADAMARVGVSVADVGAGLYASGAILAALFGRTRTGRGERIDIAMLECLTEWLTPAIYHWLGQQQVVARVGMRHGQIVPYGVYACADGAVNFAIQNEGQWRRFCAGVLGEPGLADDPRFGTNPDRLRHRAILEPLIEQRFSARSAAEVIAACDAADIPNGRVNDVPGVVAHPQLAARGRWATVDSPVGPIPALLPPLNLLSAPSAMGAIPGLGEHTCAVLRELGYDEVAIARLVDLG
ncbi:MAG: L-carnitine dehydratase/bile acid-inducible protein F [uncultured Thermomicrobiales bacterium]|uniref:L-carnitine dehydratase/bile acid-inducible protein F n=1 Tax=uncultured Thermomicrobiales bacterium TaxID=1645740 RepID=A0A6J4VNG3_9BACT|nr:MAG: L-carnitine dehydratase/bile acid-inducible protein F [uncultured Thermomicrobiales bacterium]